jgi:hypothetical protein
MGVGVQGLAQVNVDTGDDDDTVKADVLAAAFGGEASVGVETGNGYDDVSADVTGLSVAGTSQANLSTGKDNDIIQAGTSLASATGTVERTLDGGHGTNVITTEASQTAIGPDTAATAMGALLQHMGKVRSLDPLLKKAYGIAVADRLGQVLEAMA